LFVSVYKFCDGISSEMSDLSKFEKRQNFGVRMAGASITVVTKIFGFSTNTASRAMKKFLK